MRYVMGMQEPLDTLIPRDDCARENRKHDGYAGQVLDAAIAKGEPFARLLARKPECDRKRYRGRGITEIMNRIREQRHAPGDENDKQLQDGRSGETDERPLDRPESAVAGRNRGIDNAVRVARHRRMIIMPMVMGMVVPMII